MLLLWATTKKRSHVLMNALARWLYYLHPVDLETGALENFAAGRGGDGALRARAAANREVGFGAVAFAAGAAARGCGG